MNELSTINNFQDENSLKASFNKNKKINTNNASSSQMFTDGDFDNSTHNLNNSEEYAEIMTKINKEADNFANIEDINIFDKYQGLKESQIKQEIKVKK